MNSSFSLLLHQCFHVARVGSGDLLRIHLPKKFMVTFFVALIQ